MVWIRSVTERWGDFKGMNMGFYTRMRNHRWRQDVYKAIFNKKVSDGLNKFKFFFEKVMHLVTPLLEVISMLVVPKIQYERE